MEETITISKSELERLVATEIAKQSFPRTRHDFSGVAIDGKDILKVNNQHPIVKEKLNHTYTRSMGSDIHEIELRGYGSNRDSVFARNRNISGRSEWSHTKVYTADIHQTLRNLAVRVMGGTVIRDLEPDEFDFALSIYEDFKQLFLEKYNQRLDREEMITEL